MSSKGRIVFPHGIPGAQKHEGEACVITMCYRTGEQISQPEDNDMKYAMHSGWKYDDLIDLITKDVDNTFKGADNVDRICFVRVELVSFPAERYN